MHNPGSWRDGWFVVPYDVAFRDIDYFGHVNNAVYFTFFEIGRTLLWFDLTGGREPDAIGFIVARAECDFRAQVEMGPVEICVRIGGMRTSSLYFDYEIRKGEEKLVAASGRTVVVLFDWTSRSKIAIPDDLRARIESHMAEQGPEPSPVA